MRSEFVVRIDAPVSRVWEVLQAPDTYREWTSAFCEGSYYEGGWEHWSEIRFLSPGGSGICGVIEDCQRHKWISIRHIGAVHAGRVDTESESVKAWAPLFENYEFRDDDGTTVLTVQTDLLPGYEDILAKCWPEALAQLKKICEE